MIELKTTEEHLENIVNLLRRQLREIGISLEYAECKLKAYQDELYVKYHGDLEDIKNPKPKPTAAEIRQGELQAEAFEKGGALSNGQCNGSA